MWKIIVLAANMQLQAELVPTKDACVKAIEIAHPSVQKHIMCINMQPGVTETYSGENVMKQRGER